MRSSARDVRRAIAAVAARRRVASTAMAAAVAVSASVGITVAAPVPARAGGSTIAALTVTASDAPKPAFAGAPTAMPAGLVTVTLKNAGNREHELRIVRVDAGKGVRDVVAALTADPAAWPSWMHAASGVGAVAPSGSASVTLNLAPGRFVLFDGGRTPAGALFAAQGLATLVEVTGKVVKATLPDAPTRVTARDGGFDIAGVTPGTNTIRFTNASKTSRHQFVAFQVRDGAAIEEVRAFVADRAGFPGTPPVDTEATRAAQVLEPGASANVQLRFTGGKTYVFACLVVDRATGLTHAARGMTAVVAVG